MTIVVITGILYTMFEDVQKELKQTKPFSSSEEAAALSIQLTAEALKTKAADLFKTKDLTAVQYNVLRILRGAGKDGISCREIGDRMITRDSDITRMLDRLDARGLIKRERQTDDRRVVLTFITEEGRSLLAELDRPVRDLNKKLLGHLSERELNTLGKLLAKIRDPN